MPLAARFVDALKKCLRARGMTYAALGRELRLSEASVKRMFSRGTFTLSRIEGILRVLELDLVEVARMARGGDDQARELSLPQEELLASDERLLSVFWLLLNGWGFADIVEDFEITRTELTLALAKFDRARLIDWDAGERVRLRVAKDFVWRPGGPVKKAYGLRVTTEFLRSPFRGALELLRFEARDLSPGSAAMLRRRLERLAAEFNELAEVDSTLPARRREGVGLLLACRPWTFSAMMALRRRDQAVGQRSKRA
ncbi:MAG TPA: helix-turn-helix domain-containing protein [Burkholderiales bacterium]|nr:helix-turn-helix domain-containing protein [Burkholderiales bacterium]